MIGVDEVGRGAWAGPLLVCAARLKPGHSYPVGLTDSKTLTKKQREKLFPKIVDAFDVGEGWVAAEIIDEYGLSAALNKAGNDAVNHIIRDSMEEVVIDGTVNLLNGTQFTNVSMKKKADLTIPEVSAAAIYAKVLRDRYMAEQAEQYPEYGFALHVGYGTQKHRKALESHGVTPLHRHSFKPVQPFASQ